MSENLTLSPNLKSTRLGFRLFRHKYVWLALTPFILMLVFFGYRGFQEWRADQAIQQQIAQWDKAGVPYDNDTLQMSYVKGTFPEGLADWDRVIRLTAWGSRTKSYSQLPYLGSEGKPPEVLVPDDNNDQWADEALVAGYLDEMQPVIDLIEQASTHPTPVRFPMHFQGFNTLLPHIQSSRSIARILWLDCDYAYSKNNTQRALRDLSLMQSTIDAFESRDFLVSLLVTNAIHGMRLRSVRRTLTHCVWDESQLAALRESMSADEDIVAPFREALSKERALSFVSLKEAESLKEIYGLTGQSKRVANDSILPSDLLLLIEQYNKLIAAGDGSILQWIKRDEELGRQLNADHSNSIAAMLLPATQQCIGASIRLEQTRRWTLTAIALRQYQQQYGSWPQQLSDLEAVGLKFADYSNLKGEMFGYEVDGETVYLWQDDTNNGEGPISSTRPIEKKEGGMSLEHYLLELHARL